MPERIKNPSDALIDIDADHIIHNDRMVRVKLLGMSKAFVPIIILAGADRGVSEIVDVYDTSEIILDRVIALSHLNQGAVLAFEANNDGVKCYFRAEILTNDNNGMIISWPKPFYWVNYREYHRVEVPPSSGVTCRIDSDDESSLIHFRVLNFSLSGLAIQTHEGQNLNELINMFQECGVILNISGQSYKVKLTPKYIRDGVIGCSMEADKFLSRGMDKTANQFINKVEFDKINKARN